MNEYIKDILLFIAGIFVGYLTSEFFKKEKIKEEKEDENRTGNTGILDKA